MVLVGSFDDAFLDIPPEVIRATIRANQKCFVLRRPTGASFEAPLRGAPQEGVEAREGVGVARRPKPVGANRTSS